MAMKAILTEEDHGQLPEALRSEYRRGDDGRYFLDVEQVDGYGLENGEQIRTALTNERKVSKEAQRKLKAYADLGDPDAVREAVERAREFDENPPEDIEAKVKSHREALEKQFAAKERQLTERMTQEIATRDARIAGLDREVSAHVVDAAGSAAIAAAGGNVELLLPHLRASVRAVREEGSDRAVARVMEDDGENPRLSARPGATGPMTIEEFVSDGLRKKFPGAFEGSGKQGSGKDGDSGGRRTSGAGANTFGASRIAASRR